MRRYISVSWHACVKSDSKINETLCTPMANVFDQTPANASGANLQQRTYATNQIYAIIFIKTPSKYHLMFVHLPSARSGNTGKYEQTHLLPFVE